MAKVEIPDIMIKTGIGKLIFLPAGSATDGPLNFYLLMDEKIIHEMKYRYNE